MLAAARVTLKQHRFEVVAAVLAALAVGVWALVVQYRLNALNVPPECIRDWLYTTDARDQTGGCAGPMRAWSSILQGEGGAILDGEGTISLSAMGILPFMVGLLGGVPLVARELEARTAQTAWSLNGSRLRWLLRQVTPVAILLGIAVTFAAFAVEGLAAANVAWGGYASFLIGVHGPLVLARALGAFGIGLLVGALLGRTLPAFVLGAALLVALLFAVGAASDAWLAGLEPQVIAKLSPETEEYDLQPRAVTTGWGVRTPDGILISIEDATALARAAGAPEPAPGDVQDIPALEWFEQNGYTLLPLGVTDEMALGWAPYDGVVFSLVGLGSIAGAALLVNRRRPV